MDSVQARNVIVVHPEDTEPLGFIFEDALPAGVVVDSATIAVEPAGQLAFTGIVPNDAAFRDEPAGRGRLVPVGKAVLAEPSGQLAGQDYTVTVVAELSTGKHKGGVWIVACRSRDDF